MPKGRNPPPTPLHLPFPFLPLPLSPPLIHSTPATGAAFTHTHLPYNRTCLPVVGGVATYVSVSRISLFPLACRASVDTLIRMDLGNETYQLLPPREEEDGETAPPPPAHLLDRKGERKLYSSAEERGSRGQEGEGQEASANALCNTFGCTLPYNHYGLHKLPDAPLGSSRQRRTALRNDGFNFKEIHPPLPLPICSLG